MDLFLQLLHFNPIKRLTVLQALQHVSLGSVVVSSSADPSTSSATAATAVVSFDAKLEAEGEAGLDKLVAKVSAEIAHFRDLEADYYRALEGVDDVWINRESTRPPAAATAVL